MKPRAIASLVLVTMGLAMCIFTTARQRITERVLTRAARNVEAVLEKRVQGEHQPSGDDLKQALDMEREIQGAIYAAGGAYYGWNEALLPWTLSGVMIVAGFLLSFVEPREKRS